MYCKTTTIKNLKKKKNSEVRQRECDKIKMKQKDFFPKKKNSSENKKER